MPICEAKIWPQLVGLKSGHRQLEFQSLEYFPLECEILFLALDEVHYEKIAVKD